MEDPGISLHLPYHNASCFVFPQGRWQKLCQSADASNKHPQILGGLYQYTWIACSLYCIVGQLRILVPAIVTLGLGLMQQPPPAASRHGRGKEADGILALHVSASKCYLSLPFTFHWLRPVIKPCPVSKGVGKSNQEFGQVASVTALHIRCPCPSGPLSPQHTTQMLVSESSAEYSTSCPGACVLRGLPSFLTCLQYTSFLFSSQRSMPSFERCSSNLLSSVQMCSDQGRPGFSSD